MILTIIGVVLVLANLVIFRYNIRLYRKLKAIQVAQESVYMSKDSVS